MTDDAQLRAFEVLREHPRLADLVTLTREVALSAARARTLASGSAAVAGLAEARALSRPEADTAYGNALAVLERGPEDGAERRLVRALWAHGLAQLDAAERNTESTVTDLLWLAAHTPYDALDLLDHALGPQAAPLWEALAEQLRRADEGRPASVHRGEACLAALALAASPAPSALTQRARLAAELTDPLLRLAVAGAAAPAPLEPLQGELTARPRGPILTALLAVTGLLLLQRGGELLLRGALAYRRPASVAFGNEGVTVTARTEVLGRPLARRTFVLPYGGLVRVGREVRYPRAAFYAGLLALILGSYFGLAFFVDGVRAASPSLLLTGLLVVAAGVALDFALTSLAPSAVRRCRLVLEPMRGAAVAVGNVDIAAADAALEVLRQGVPGAPTTERRRQGERGVSSRSRVSRARLDAASAPVLLGVPRPSHPDVGTPAPAELAPPSPAPAGAGFAPPARSAPAAADGNTGEKAAGVLETPAPADAAAEDAAAEDAKAPDATPVDPRP